MIFKEITISVDFVNVNICGPRIFYTILFTIEMAFRVAANGKKYFCSHEWACPALTHGAEMAGCS